MTKKQSLIVAAFAIFGFLALTSLFVVDQTEQVIVLQFKKPQRIIAAPGLKAKLPWETVERFEKRVMDYRTERANTYIAGDQKRLEVDAFLKYKITNPLKFLQTVGSERILIGRLDNIMESALRKVVSEVPLSTLLTEKRAELMDAVKNIMNGRAEAFGIEVIDVRIVRADFPEKNRDDIYARMISEREREAKDLRAKGAEEATIIKAQADKEKTVLLAEAENKAQVIRGEGEGESTRIFAEAFGRDPEFFKFYRTMQAYKEALKKEDTTLILSPDSEFLKFFDNSGGN